VVGILNKERPYMIIFFVKLLGVFFNSIKIIFYYIKSCYSGDFFLINR